MNSNQTRNVTIASTAIALFLGGGFALAQVPPPPNDRTPQPWPAPSAYKYEVSPDGKTTTVTTPQGNFPPSDPWVNPTNLLPTRYENVKAADGTEIPNTLSSSPEHPYNLHDDPVVTPINKTSPTDDLAAIFKAWHRKGNPGKGDERDEREAYSPDGFSKADLQRAIDILEGNPVSDRVYSGIPMMHYAGSSNLTHVDPIKDASGNVIGGTATIHQVWFDTHIESDTAFLDVRDVKGVPFTINYIVDTLNKGQDDFSPMQMYLDPTAVPGAAIPLVTMDLTFFPMEDGTRTQYKLKFAPGKNFNLTYTWGWRRHPPRVQVTENAFKPVGKSTPLGWEQAVFGSTPRASQADKEAAIAKIGDLAPSKRMWKAFRSLLNSGYNPVVMAEAERAFFQWQDRNSLPDGVSEDPDADMTLFYVDNTIYGRFKKNNFKSEAQPILDKWHTRPATVKVKLVNGDYFDHGYVSVDFGGMRGWENTFHNTLPVGGDGAFFTFGRAWWEMNTPTPIIIPAATQSANPTPSTPPAIDPEIYKNREFWMEENDPEGKRMFARPRGASLKTSYGTTLGEATVILNLNYEPSLRLRLYQFDPLHHEQAIWSIH
ncbi:hypothetical protein OGR47_15575 [Methylocystis sp. MJC1]|uniref:hypothetical protein n=1 Tax=Methylocystis sp. MJC1 TaxID=2654282 RepID=UPI001C1E4CF0|nr:hypothetical protein [Methylocystis sp. MJC1]KAF2989856.1 hypothetical protein MJC1_02992 [Methylocystis sp. MJC1]MBU6528377.1 hypothetical protein [Methylocystis sp. MJC1]UZX11280.1 hypothetical protein OGR47_15575 [Methylocystis sp. MJC1]